VPTTSLYQVLLQAVLELINDQYPGLLTTANIAYIR
jgi:hypothetical protein